nr:MAG TPA: hypothetical protein [Caudoviricetes sp.]
MDSNRCCGSRWAVFRIHRLYVFYQLAEVTLSVSHYKAHLLVGLIMVIPSKG